MALKRAGPWIAGDDRRCKPGQARPKGTPPREEGQRPCSNQLADNQTLPDMACVVAVLPLDITLSVTKAVQD